MKIRELINAFTDKKVDPSLLEMELFIVTGTEKFDASKHSNPMPSNPKAQSGMFDGATIAKLKPIEGIVMAQGGWAAFTDPSKETEQQAVFMVSAEDFPSMIICGKAPTALK